MSIKDFDSLVAQLNKVSKPKRVILIGAEDSHSIEAMMLAQKDNIVHPILVGNKGVIASYLKELNFS